MGGIGSGRHCGSGKATTSDYRAFDVRHLQREGLLQPGRNFEWQWSRDGGVVAFIEVRTELDCVRLSYRHRRYDEPWQSEDYPVSIEWTPCNYGGERAWFRCPATGCGRRVAILYGGGIFACRHCHRLNYESQHEQSYQRALTRYQNIRIRLGAHAAIGQFPDKPKGMHWRTYGRLCREAERANVVSWPSWIMHAIAR